MKFYCRFTPAFLLLASMALTFQGPVLAQKEQGKDLPKADTLMDGYVKKTGGKEAYDKIKTWIVKANFAFAGVNGDATIYGAAPNKMYLGMMLQGIGKVEAGSDGKVFWEKNPITGPKLHNEDKSKEMFPGVDFGGDVNWKQQYKSYETEALEKVDGKELYRVKLVEKKGDPEYRYFDKGTGLVVKMKKAMKSELGNFTMDVDISEYKKVGDLLIPHKVNANMLGQNVKVTLTDVQLNAEIPKGTFDLPNEVKELIKKKAGESK